jgi:hypothetical protein
VIQVDLDGQPPFPMNQYFKPMVLINHDIHPFDEKWNVIPSSFVNYIHPFDEKWNVIPSSLLITNIINDFLVVLCTCLQHSVNAPDPIRTP